MLQLACYLMIVSSKNSRPSN